MKIAIPRTLSSFNKRWWTYLENKSITYKLVDCYDNDIINQLEDCDVFLWHFHQGNPKDILFAKQLLYSLQTSGKLIFPDFNTVWHFDDKVGQKYLLEAIGAPIPETCIFYNENDAVVWARRTAFPKVLKLRGGAGSQNVFLVKSRKRAIKYIRKAFGRGLPAYNAWGSLKERWEKYKHNKTDLRDVIEGIVRLLISPPYARISGRQKGYIYFQEFIEGNDSDIRVIVIEGKAFALKRMVRENDFRASGSGKILFDRKFFEENTVKLAIELARKLKSQCVAFDFVYDKKTPKVLEVSYGFVPDAYDHCPGYWDSDLKWHEGSFNPYAWIVDSLIQTKAVQNQNVND